MKEMELYKKNSRSSEAVSEYQDAKDRFNKFSEKVARNKDSSDSEFDSKSYLDEIILKLCRGDASIEIGRDSSLFYEIIFYSDFIQIKSDIIETFYAALCEKFILSNPIEDISKHLNKLEDIDHVKTYIIQGLCKILRVTTVVMDGVLILRYSQRNVWSDIDLKGVTHILLQPCAYKVLMCHHKFNLTHLNLIFKLTGAQNINLNGCNLKGWNTMNLFKDLQLKSLNLSECGTSVNEIIGNNIDGALKNLTHLNLSKNPLFNETLENIRCIPLKSLDISDCIKKSGRFIDSIWFAKSFTLDKEGEKASEDIDLLWKQGVLKEKIEVLNVSNNILTLSNLQKILELQLRELDISGCLKHVEFSKVTFPESLHILKTKRNDIYFEEFQALCTLQLETLEINYCGKENENFSGVSDCPLRSSLKELYVCVSDPCEDIIDFISKFKLQRFECELATDECSIDNFIANHPEERKHLISLTIKGPALDVTEKFVSEFKKLNLTELSLSLPSSSLKFLVLLCCENIHHSIVKLSLDEEDVQTEDLIQILKFKKLEKLSFQYSKSIDVNYLKSLAKMSALKQLELKAVVRGQLEQNLALALCILPVKTLIIYDDYGRSISDEAFEYLSNSEHSVKFSKNLVSLHMRTTIKSNMASILRNCNWEDIVLDDCIVEDDVLKLMLDNENLIFTLHYLKFSNLDVNWKDIARLNLSKLDVQMFDLPDSAVPNLVIGSISKFLRYLFLENYKCEVNLNALLQTNLSEVDTY